MFRGKPSDSGQVLIIFVFAAVALIAIVGLAIDGANVLSDRRHAQNAADTAALAAGLYKAEHLKLGDPGCNDFSQTCGANVELQALNLALANGYPGSEVEVHSPPIDGPYSHDTYAYKANDYVQVIINSQVDTFFARILGIGQLHNRVEAVVLAKYVGAHQLFPGSGLVSLAPTGSGCGGQIIIQGSSQVTLNNAGIFVNSDNSNCAISVQKCSNLSLSSPIGLVGGAGASLPGSCTPTYQTAPVAQVQFPPDPIFSTPAECNIAGTSNPKKDANGNYHLAPGFYSQLPPNPASRSYVLDLDANGNGVFCTDNFSPKGPFTGNGVLIWIRPGGSFTTDANSALVLTAATSPSKYAGYVIYEDSTYAQIPDANNKCGTFNGNSGDIITGVIYAPDCDLKINGTSNTTGLNMQLIGYTITDINGNANLTINQQGFTPANVPQIDWTGLYH